MKLLKIYSILRSFQTIYLQTHKKKRENENGAVLQKMHYEIEMSFGNEFCLNLFY